MDNPRLSIKICQTCKTEFTGGTTARFCPSCRAERIRQRDREKYQRRQAGTLRKVGSTDTCKLCGQPYTVQGGYQKYCPPCQVTENKRRSSESHKRLYPARRGVLLKRSREWALAHPDRVAETLRKSYRRNLLEIIERRRKRGLKLRPLGRQESCPRCGQQFTVTERNQRYCDNCRDHRRLP